MTPSNFDSNRVNIPSSIFRAYDIRGIYEKSLTPDMVYEIGVAIGSELRDRGSREIITARDGRISSPILAMALQRGLLASGCDVIDIGEVPTPVLYFATKILSTDSGVMITGSHNPKEYNGIKMVLKGKTLAEEEIKGLYQRIQKQELHFGHGQISEANVIEQYLERITSEIKLKRKLRVVLDCGNGIASVIAPTLLKKLGCDVIELCCEVDGEFPNHDPDPSQPENVAHVITAVKQNFADIGILLDGDADRLGVVTNRGQIIWPDRQMMLFAEHILKSHPNSKIIYDVKCTRNLADVIRKNGGEPIMWKTGHSLIKAKMLESDAKFAGEMSGHLFFNDRWYGFDDGMYAACRLLEILVQDTRDAAAIFRCYPDSINTPELKVAIADDEKFIFMEHFAKHARFPEATVTDIDGIRVEFPEGWGLLRPSNTTPYLTLRFEARDENSLSKIKSLFRDQMVAMGVNAEF